MKLFDRFLSTLDGVLLRVFGLIGGLFAGLLVAGLLIFTGIARWCYFPGLDSTLEAALYYLGVVVACGILGLIGGVLWPKALTYFISPFVNLLLNDGEIEMGEHRRKRLKRRTPPPQ
ncbi:MAG: hypothetical protein ACIAXF_13425 [Phycisphaerales bacterium JB063]